MVDMLEAGKTGKRKYLSDFDEDQIVLQNGLRWSVLIKSSPRKDKWIQQATVGQIAEKVDAGLGRKVSEHTVHTQWSPCLDWSGLFWQ